jgi:hypothetical protein
MREVTGSKLFAVSLDNVDAHPPLISPLGRFFLDLVHILLRCTKYYPFREPPWIEELSIQTQVAYAVELIAEDVAKWPPYKTAAEYTVGQVPNYLVVLPLSERIGYGYVVAFAEAAVSVKRRPMRLKIPVRPPA